MKSRKELMALILEHFKTIGPKSQEDMVKSMLLRIGDMDLLVMAQNMELVAVPS